MNIHVLTLFPEMLVGPLTESVLKKAQERGVISISPVNIRDFAHDKHKTCDDRPYGGGPGMVMKPEPIFEAVESVQRPESKLILLTPRGRLFDQKVALDLACEKHLVFICGHYEGVDERISTGLKPLELSIGDYVLSNGALAAAVVIDAVCRLVPGVLGNNLSVEEDSLYDGAVKFPQYTRPQSFRGMDVPEVLAGGNHAQVRTWREEQAREYEQRRQDLRS